MTQDELQHRWRGRIFKSHNGNHYFVKVAKSITADSTDKLLLSYEGVRLDELQETGCSEVRYCCHYLWREVTDPAAIVKLRIAFSVASKGAL